MNIEHCVRTLTELGAIPNDARVVSTNNKVVTISDKERVVSRISDLSLARPRDDPHNLDYSHRVAWFAGESGAVVKPLHEEPEVHGDYLVSTYPLLQSDIELNAVAAPALYTLLRALGNALPAVAPNIALRQVDIATYVRERLGSMRDNSTYDQRHVDYITEVLDYLESQCPFRELVDADPALIHGDIKADNIVKDIDNHLQLIDLDAAAVGPRYFDLSSWRLRAALGDKGPVDGIVDIWRQQGGWNEETYRALIGWKAVSSMSFTTRYESPDISSDKVVALAAHANKLAYTPGFRKL